MTKKKKIETRTKKQHADEYIKNNQWSHAKKLYQEISRIDPRDFEAWFRLGVIHGTFTDYIESEQCTRKALTLEPENVAALCNLAGALESQDRHEEALNVFRRVHELNPQASRPVSSMANIYQKLGQLDKAYELIRPLIDATVIDVNAAMCYTRLCSKLGDSGEALAYAQQVLQHSSTNIRVRQKLLFRLANLQDSRTEYDEAFNYICKANDRKNVVYAARQHENDVDSILATFTRATMGDMPVTSNNSLRPVFIVGMPRSGSSLLEQILDCHSQIVGAGELRNIHDIVSSLSSRSAQANNSLNFKHDLFNAENLNNLSQQYLAMLNQVSSTALRVTDKMPGNCLWLGVIQLLFPQAHVIHIQREPLDTCLSCYFRDIGPSHTYSYDLLSLGHKYQQYQRVMAHWRKELSIPVYELRYEDLVNDQEKISRELVTFLGLEWEPACLEFHKSDRLVKTASYEQVRQPLYRKSMARWKNYEKHLAPLIGMLGHPDKPETRS